jgi:hypothetical protein
MLCSKNEKKEYRLERSILEQTHKISKSNAFF